MGQCTNVIFKLLLLCLFVSLFGFNSLKPIYKLLSNERLVESDDIYSQLKRSAFSSGIDRLFIEIQ